MNHKSRDPGGWVSYHKSTILDQVKDQITVLLFGSPPMRFRSQCSYLKEKMRKA